jgi:dolichol-phosphate mannosyltransferase
LANGVLSITIPTRNEPRVEDLVTQLRQTMRSHNQEFDILAIDKSDDDTPDRLRTMGVKVIEQKSTGLGGAIVEALKTAQGDPVIVMDADLSHDPKYIPVFLQKYSEGFDVVVGSRRTEGGSIVGWGVYRKAVSKFGNMLGRWLAGIKISDVTSGFRLYRRKMIESIAFENFRSTGYAFQIEILAAASEKGFRIGTVPIVFQDRAKGVSKLSKKDILEFLLTAIRLGWRRFRRALLETAPAVQNN